MDIYTEAVRCRLRSYRNVGLTLSGGLDSGSIAALASKEFHEKNERLKAFSSVPIYNLENLGKVLFYS